jgi:pimeloyl-ACP methyl ester carboxylesterase
MIIRVLFIVLAFSFTAARAQLQPGFDKTEYARLMMISAQFGDSAYRVTLPPPPGFTFVYRSPVVGLDNCWELWRGPGGEAIISIRGTTVNQKSWLANFYAAMVPAQGTLQLSATDTFHYDLSPNPRAAVHVGWLVGMAFLWKDMQPKIDSLQKAGIRSMIIIGHSQGGAIAFLLTAHLYRLQALKQLPADLRLKTYCSAGPKPGNLYFAYDYEAATQGGWAFNVVNSSDWVPETPVSLQVLSDFNNINPFSNAGGFMKKQPWPQRWALNYAFGRLTKPSRKAVRNYQKYLGKFVARSVVKSLPGYSPPAYFNSNHYVRTGNTIVLLADEAYFQKFPQDGKNIFINHLHAPYLYLLEKL